VAGLAGDRCAVLLARVVRWRSWRSGPGLAAGIQRRRLPPGGAVGCGRWAALEKLEPAGCGPLRAAPLAGIRWRQRRPSSAALGLPAARPPRPYPTRALDRSAWSAGGVLDHLPWSCCPHQPAPKSMDDALVPQATSPALRPCCWPPAELESRSSHAIDGGRTVQARPRYWCLGGRGGRLAGHGHRPLARRGGSRCSDVRAAAREQVGIPRRPASSIAPEREGFPVRSGGYARGGGALLLEAQRQQLTLHLAEARCGDPTAPRCQDGPTLPRC